MPSDESKGNQLDAIGSLAQRQLDNTVETLRLRDAQARILEPRPLLPGRVLAIQEARVRGHLFEGPGFPVLEVPDEDLLAHGTGNPVLCQNSALLK